VARFAQHWNFVGGTVEEFSHKREVLYEHCADLGRNPEEILLSSHVRFEGGPSAVAETAAALEQAGVQLAIVPLLPPHDPAVLEPLAEAFRALG